MKYRVRSQMLIDLNLARFTNFPGVNRIWRVLAITISIVAYLGVIVAPAVVSSLPFQILHAFRIKPPSASYWIVASIILTLSIWLLCRITTIGYRSLRQGIISLDTIFGVIGVTLAIIFILWTLPTGWIPYA
jgi:hypothetical protein